MGKEGPDLNLCAVSTLGAHIYSSATTIRILRNPLWDDADPAQKILPELDTLVLEVGNRTFLYSRFCLGRQDSLQGVVVYGSLPDHMHDDVPFVRVGSTLRRG